jgi:thiamine biosynthesis lipoprotein
MNAAAMPLRVGLLWLALLAAGCSADGDARLERRLFAMGTWVDVTLVGTQEAQATAALGEIEAMLRGFERDYYAWTDGTLARLNAGLSAGNAVEVDADMVELLQQAKRLAEQSGYVFDPAVGGLVELWGFHSDLSDVTEPPEPEQIRAWLDARPSIAALRVSGRAVSGGSPGLKLDLGGIAKGKAVDRIVAILRTHGIDHALVNAGGDLRVLGNRGDSPWRIGIRSPRSDGVIGVAELADGESAFTSGDYERYYDLDGRRLHHILDPSTGYPAEHTQAVTVITSDGTSGDAAATAVFVAGPLRWRQVARDMGVALVLRVDADGNIEMSDEMRDRLQASAKPGSDILLKI